ncbi:MAG: 30S ribosomal protein S21 [Candidatus Saccharibacteria bacterium]|nr:30S ribosomal protein S21 [Candidatus Saccharibacteria bacterium]
MIQVTRRSEREQGYSLLRRFNRRVQQAGILVIARNNKYFSKPISKRERRIQAVKRNRRQIYRPSYYK